MWEFLRDWCHDSETIVWARVQLVLGATWAILTSTDLSPILPPAYLPYWLIASGIVTEVLRRARATDL